MKSLATYYVDKEEITLGEVNKYIQAVQASSKSEEIGELD